MNENNASQQIIGLINEYMRLSDPLMITQQNIDKEGNQSMSQIFIRASKHFDIRDIKDREPSDRLTEVFLNKAKLDRAKLMFPMTMSLLRKRFYDRKINEKMFNDFMIQSKHREEDHSAMFNWCYSVCVLLDILSDVQVVEYAVIKDEAGIIQGVQRLPEKSEETNTISGSGEGEDDNKEQA